MTSNGHDRARVATIFDVARLAGVSHQTVSRVVNDLPNVRTSTRERVEHAIAQLRYVPSQAARSLVTRRSRTLGLVATGLPDFGPSSMMHAFNEAARLSGYAVITATPVDTDPTGLRAAAEMLIRQSVEAVVLFATDRRSVDALDEAELGVPLVVVGSERTRGVASVALDQYAAARIAVTHLLRLGFPTVAHIAGPPGSMDAEERLRGWRDAVAETGMPVDEPLRGDWSPDSGYRLGRELLADHTAPVAVFCGNDQMSIGLYHAAAELGLSVPADVSVVGFDDIPEAAHLLPPLTTMNQDFGTLGRDALTAILGLLRDDESQDVVRAPSRVPRLIVRASTAAPASA